MEKEEDGRSGKRALERVVVGIVEIMVDRSAMEGLGEGGESEEEAEVRSGEVEEKE